MMKKELLDLLSKSKQLPFSNSNAAYDGRNTPKNRKIKKATIEIDVNNLKML